MIGFGKFKIIFITLFTSFMLTACSVPGTNTSALQITTNPQASVFLNEKHLGKTPYFSDQLKEGTYTVKIAAGEASYVEKIELKKGALTVVNRDLNNNMFAQSGEVLWLEQGTRDLFIASNPSEAEVVIDGQFKGLTPTIIRDLDVGDHKVKITKNNFLEREFSVKTSSEYKLIANVTLASQTAKNIQSTERESTAKIEILPTPQKFLRVRKEPQLTSQEVGQVNSGNNYELIQEVEGWIKINFDGKMGWVPKEFVKNL